MNDACIRGIGIDIVYMYSVLLYNEKKFEDNAN